MKKFLVSIPAAALLLAACTAEIPQDRPLCGGRTVKGVKTVVVSAPQPGFPGMTVRSVAFVNEGTAPVSIDAVETSRISVSGPAIWSFQPTSSEARKDWAFPVEKGFYQRNYLGMNDSDYGGGIPMVCIWTPGCNLSVGLAEPELKLVSMPVSRKGNTASACIRQDFSGGVVLQPGDTLRCVEQFTMESVGDFFAPLRAFSQYMQERYGFSMPESPADAFEPVWCAWGYERNFTVDEVIGTLPKVAELGFKWVDIDDGYQICEGDWEANDRIGPDGMRRMTDAVHAYGLRAKLWWAPLAADPESTLAREHPEMLLVQEDGSHEDITYWDSWYLSPVNPYVKAYTEALVDMFLLDWGFDGFKLDGQHLNMSAPDHNPASGLSSPEEACSRFPEFQRSIWTRARADKPGSVVQICPCGDAVNFFVLPYISQAVASDPTSSLQIRQKRRAYAAMCPKLAYYADHVELSDGGNDFASQIGVGGIIGTKFTWPAPNPYAHGDGQLLTPEREAELSRWIKIYGDKMLSTGEYLNLYDTGFDRPEAHVIAKDGAMYYAFYAPSWKGEPIVLRGLEAREYTVCEYTLEEPRSYTVTGPDPVINPVFEGNYLIEVR